VGRQELEKFADSLEKTPQEFKDKMKKLTPGTYTGLAQDLVEFYFANK
jgi:adenylosuccinate lyase